MTRVFFLCYSKAIAVTLVVVLVLLGVGWACGLRSPSGWWPAWFGVSVAMVAALTWITVFVWEFPDGESE